MRKKLETGEDYASAYLKGSFWRLFSGDAIAPFDRSCQELLQARDAVLLWAEPTLFFHFQVKEGPSYWSDGISVVRSTFESWLRHVERQPVFLLYVREINATSQEYWYLPLHEWLLTERAQHFLVRADSTPRFSVKRDFTRSDKDARNFHAALLSEASRAIREETSPWATADDWTVFPFDEVWLLRHMERASFLELPKAVLESLRAASPFSARQRIRQLLSGDSSPVPIASEWLDSVTRLARSVPSATSFQRRQFQRFVRTVKAFEGHRVLLRLPVFRIAELSCWRTFVAVYPRSLRLLNQVVLSSPHTNDVMFAAALLPILALSEDGGLSGAAGQVLHSVQGKVSSLSPSTLAAYAFQREMLRSLIESGDRRFTASLVDLVGQEGLPTLERAFLTRYGWPPQSLRGNIERKLNRPTRRDENLKPLYEVMGDGLLS